MSKDDLCTHGWKLWWNIWLFLQITAYMCNVVKVNKLWFLVTFHTIILAFQHDRSCRITLFPDSLMSKDELCTLGWKLWHNICIFLEITGCIYVRQKSYQVMGFGDIVCHFLVIPTVSLMQKYIVFWIRDVWRWVKHIGVKCGTKYLNLFRNHCL